MARSMRIVCTSNPATNAPAGRVSAFGAWFLACACASCRRRASEALCSLAGHCPRWSLLLTSWYVF